MIKELCESACLSVSQSVSVYDRTNRDVICVYMHSNCIGALRSLLLTGNGLRAVISHFLFEVPSDQTETRFITAPHYSPV